MMPIFASKNNKNRNLEKLKPRNLDSSMVRKIEKTKK